MRRLNWPDPFADFEPLVNPENLSWHYDHAFLEALYQRCPRPRLMLEVGTWLGRSAIMAAKYYTAQLQWREFTLVCIDTWLGSTEHWLRPQTRAALHLQHGHPTLYEHFLSNVSLAGLQEYLLPLPQTSINAARILAYHELQADWVYLDASHAETDVLLDLNHYWPLVAPGGVLFGDDWNWPSVRQAVSDFCQLWHLSLEQQGTYSWAIWKP